MTVMSKAARVRIAMVITALILASVDAFSFQKKTTVETKLNVWSTSNPLIKNNPYAIHTTTWYTNYHNPTVRKVTYKDE
jgi:hypothetical protein